MIYKVIAGVLYEVGVVASYGDTFIYLTSEISNPSDAEFIVYVKNSQAESYGARGYYMDLTLTNDDITETEIFAVSSNVFLSKP